MQKIVTITDEKTIKDILDSASYGTMALCFDNRPYSIPFNFTQCNEALYFHGNKKGKKIDIIKQNNFASFSVVEEYSLLPSYFSTNTGSAKPATHLFSSVMIDGVIEIVEDYDEKVKAFQSLMEKYQPEGNFNPLSDKQMYEKIINATGMFKLIPKSISGKVKLGQNWDDERFDRVIAHLKERGTAQDLDTIKRMEQLKSDIL